MPKPEGKSFAIPKQLVWEAWRQVKANKGAPGVDEQDLDAFEKDLEDMLSGPEIADEQGARRCARRFCFSRGAPRERSADAGLIRRGPRLAAPPWRPDR